MFLLLTLSLFAANANASEHPLTVACRQEYNVQLSETLRQEIERVATRPGKLSPTEEATLLHARLDLRNKVSGLECGTAKAFRQHLIRDLRAIVRAEIAKL